MATYTITASNWNSGAFWASIVETSDGHTLDFSGLGPGFTLYYDEEWGRFTLSDGLSQFTVGEAGATDTNANLGDSTQLSFFSVVGATGGNTIFTGDGNDTITGSEMGDNINSGWSSSSAPDDDIVYGGGGNDFVQGGAGADTLYGGEGNDTIGISEQDGNDTIFGGEDPSGTDNDLLDLYQTGTGQGVSVTYTGDEAGSFTFAGTAATGTFAQFESLELTSANDVLDASAATQSVTIFAGAGADILIGGSGADFLAGGTDADVIYGGSGDTILGGEEGDDNDRLILTFADVSEVIYGGGTNEAGTVLFNDGGTLSFSEIEGIVFEDAVDGTADNDVMEVGYTDAQNDQIDGADGPNDAIDAGAGNDTINAGLGDDLVYAGDGDDCIRFSADFGNDTVDGGAGYDLLDFTDTTSQGGISAVWTGDTSGIVAAAGSTVTFDGIESILATGDADYFDASASTLNTLRLYGGDGNDTILGASGDDNIYAGSANTAGPDDDLVYAGLGNDYVEAGAGNDTLFGGAGNDVLAGGTGQNRLFGGDGDDRLLGTATGISDFTVLEGGLGADTIDGTLGYWDIASYFGSDAGVTVDLSDGLAESGGHAQGDTLIEVEQVDGSDLHNDAIIADNSGLLLRGWGGDDTLMGGGGGDSLWGDAGHDRLDGGAGDDDLRGGAGNDTLEGGVGNDQMDGEADRDLFILRDGHGNDTVTGGETGDDWDVIDASGISQNMSVLFSQDEGGVISAGMDNVQFSQIEEIRLGSGADVVDASATGANLTLAGGAGADTLIGGRGNDALFGGGNADIFVFSGIIGNDCVYGGHSYDTLDLSGLSHSVEVVFTGPGAGVITVPDTGETITFENIEELILSPFGDQVDASLGEGYTYIQARDGNDLIQGSAGDDIYDDEMVGPNGQGSDTFFGADGNDTLWMGTDNDLAFGGNGNDSLEGQEGDDTLSGDAGDDTLHGMSGDDVLAGGTGADALFGGADRDLILLSDGFGADTITGGDLGRDFDVIDTGALTQGVNLVFTGDEAGTVTNGTDTSSFFEVEGLSLTDQADNIDAAASASSLVAGGAGGNDTMVGSMGDDVLLGDGRYTNLIQNGSFENTTGMTPTSWGWRGDDAIAPGGWFTGSGGVIDIHNSGSAAPSDGTNWLDMEAVTDIDTVSQSVQGIIFGQPYTLRFDAIDVIGDNAVNVFWNGQLIDTVAPDSAAHQSYSYDLVGGSGDGSNTLTFQSLGPIDMIGVAIDNVQIMGFSSLDVGTGDDVLDGGAGHDTLIGGNGDDILIGRAGSDMIFGGDGNDTVQAGSDDDTLEGGIGDDLLYGEDGADLLSGGDSNDTLHGGAANDTLHGETGNDQLYGESGNDLLFGGAGEDTIAGDAGTDSIYGGDGNDFVAAGLDNDLLDGGAGNDVAVFNGDVREYSFDHDLSGALIVTDLVTDRDGQDTLSGFEYVIFNGVTYHLVTGDDGSNTTLQGPDDGTPSLIIAHDGNDWGGGHPTGDVIFGGAGDDTLDGRDGDDTLIGEDGNDLLLGGAGNHSLFGGLGADTLQGDHGNDTLDGGAGNDSLIGGAGSDFANGGDGDDFINTRMTFGAGSPDRGYPGALLADSDPANDRDTVFGGTGNDSVLTGDDNDLIFGGQGADSLDAGFDDDTVHGDDGADTIIGGEGRDLIFGGSENDLLYGDAFVGHAEYFEITDADGSDLRPDNSLDTVHGGAGNDQIFGGDDDDLLFGEEGDDQIFGGVDNDTLVGDAGNDMLFGGQGNDQLSGGEGADILDGGTGADILDGGAGNDTLRVWSGDTATGGAGDDRFDVISGMLTSAALFIDGGEDGEILGDTLNITGPANIVYDGSNPENGTVTWLDGSILTFQNIETVHYVPCFTSTTRIKTRRGEVPAAQLRTGDMVLTRNHGYQPIRWIGIRQLDRAALSLNPALNPVMIRAGALGVSTPERDLTVSPQHRMLIGGGRSQLWFGEDEVFVAAIHLTCLEGVEQIRPDSVTYMHIMFDHHQIVCGDGAWSESYQPGDMTLSGMDGEQRAEIFAIFPELFNGEVGKTYPAARVTLKKHEVPLLFARVP